MPCYDPFRTERSEALFFEIEIDELGNGCSDIFGYTIDRRFSKIGEYQISEYNLQEEAKVIEILDNDGHTTS